MNSAANLMRRAWRLLPARPRRRLLTHATALVAPRISRAPPASSDGIAVVGEFSRATGLGEGARIMLDGIRRLGVPAWPIDVGELLPASPSDFPVPVDASPPRGAALVFHVNPPLLPLALLRLPRGLVHGRRVVGYWSWELPVVPGDWRIGRRFVHDVWVPTPFTADAVEPLLARRPLIVPHPMGLAPPVPSALGRAAFGLPDGVVVVLVVFNLASSFARKNPLAAITAFRAAFGERADRLLLLKIANQAHFPDDFARIAEAASAPNIRLNTQLMPGPDLHALIGASDIVLSLHRSEGLGLVLAEAMLLGKPVITTGWSGNMAFMDATSAALVGHRLVPAEDPRQVYEGASWAEADQAEAVEHLRRLADDAAARATLGARAREMATARLGIEPLAEALRSIGVTMR
jgi:glycosyltransferase involved in cell wall biosynthesis